MKEKNHLKCRGIRYCAQERGITLIALVITIIILLILAGVTIKIAIDNSYIDKAEKAVDKYGEQQAKEKLNIAIMTYKILKHSGEEITLEETIKEVGGKIENEEEGIYIIKIDGYEFKVDNKLTIKEENKPSESEKPEEKTKYTVTVKVREGILNVTPTISSKVEEGKDIEITATVATGYVFKKWEISSGEGTINDATSAITTLTPKSDIIITAIAEKATPIIANGNNLTGTENGTLTGKQYSYNNPVIPVGFKTLTSEASWTISNGIVLGWNNGLMIQDANGNEFVWVPINGVNVKYEKWCTNGISYNDSNITGDDLPTGINEQDEIIKYGGFYIARYEAGIPTTLKTAIDTATKTARNVTGKPLSKKNQVPWNYIDYNNAKINAESMYNTDYVKSGLLTGTSWDAIGKWLENSGINVTRGTSWGNHRNEGVIGITQYSTDGGAIWKKVSLTTKSTNAQWLLKTGNSDYTKRKNIYDLSGNLWELTSEKYNSLPVYRGGSFVLLVSESVDRRRSSVNTATDSVGFRVRLFVQ